LFISHLHQNQKNTFAAYIYHSSTKLAWKVHFAKEDSLVKSKDCNMATDKTSNNHLTRRISLITLGSLLLLSSYFIVSSFFDTLATKEKESLRRLESIAKTLATQIDGDTYETILTTFPDKDDITDVDQSNLYYNQYQQLKNVQEQNNLTSPIYLLTQSADGQSLFFGVSSSDQPYFRHSYNTFPKELMSNYHKGGTLPQYHTEKGAWLSAFHPVKNSRKQTVGVIAVDEIFENFYADAANSAIKNLLISCIIVLLFVFFIRSSLQRVIKMLKDKEIAEHKANVKTKFLSTMSHEIRTPMNAVIGLSNILIQENPRKDQLENLQTLKFSADMLLALINDILDFSKIEAGKITFEQINFNLHSLVRNINQSISIRAKDKEIALKVDIDPSIPRFVISDPVRLSQILTNLIGNAIKFTTKGSVTIKLSPLQQAEGNTIIRFEVIDTGIGIPKDKFATIFRSFSQADTATTRKYGGTGLGLSITKRLLELQNSKIRLKSEVGKGSTFYFDLQLAIGETEAGPASFSEQGDATLSTHGLKGAEVLLVEDNRINVIVASKFLKKWGIKVDVAENGQIAVDKLKERDYHAVLMDLDMPVLDGYEATRIIRQFSDPRFQTLPIIALSASALADFRLKAFDAGMNEFVTKPFDPADLHATLRKFIKKEETIPA